MAALTAGSCEGFVPFNDGGPGIPTLTTTTLSVDKADLPMSLMSVYKFYLKAASLTVRGDQGWQISSIAVMGI